MNVRNEVEPFPSPCSMNRFLKKLLLGIPIEKEMEPQCAVRKKLRNIRAIWNNEYDNDMGIEKIFRLVLSISHLFFPGLYIKEIIGRKGIVVQELATDVYILLKVIYPILILKFELYNHPIFIGLLIWFLFETLLYAPTLIFASDIYDRPRSYRRSILLLFLNYLEITFAFAAIYSTGEYLNKPFLHWFDAVYFSFTTAATLGYGDFHPNTNMGRLLVSSQTVAFLIFLVLFLNFFSNKVEHKGYFDHTKIK